MPAGAEGAGVGKRDGRFAQQQSQYRSTENKDRMKIKNFKQPIFFQAMR